MVSNEPGYYETGGFGVRIENLLIVTPKPELTTAKTPGSRAFLGFDQLTHVPIQASLLEPSLLTPAEVAWLDAYHARVWERVSPLVGQGTEGEAWLRDATRPLAQQGVVVPAAAAAVAAEATA